MRDTYTSKPTSKRSTYTFSRLFWNFFYIITQNTLDTQKKEYNSKKSTKPNTYDESQNKTNVSPTASQLPSLHHNHPLLLVSRKFGNQAFTNTTSSRPNYIQSPIHYLITQQSQNGNTNEQTIEQPHTTIFQSQNNHFFSPR